MKIITACSTGLGSSFMPQLNIEKALSNLGVTGVETDHMDIAPLLLPLLMCCSSGATSLKLQKV